jgi:hypothetical protein
LKEREMGGNWVLEDRTVQLHFVYHIEFSSLIMMLEGREGKDVDIYGEGRKGWG